MRLVHLSDLHLGYRQFQRQTPAGINQREADIATVFRGVVDRVIALAPDIVVIAGDIFHNVRPPNPAILHAFSQFARLTQSLPQAIVVLVAGNHDSPRAAETGCILRLFAPLGIHVVDGEAQRLAFPERDLSILAVPDTGVPQRVQLDPDASVSCNVLVLHGEVEGILPAAAVHAERTAVAITPEELGAARWSYVALGHYHVYRQVAPNAYYCGSLEYTSANPWGELAEEKAAKLPGKGFLEYDLATGKRTFHPIKPARPLLDLAVIQARGMAASDIDAAIKANVARIPGGIEDKIVRQVVRDVPRHIAREIDHKLLRELKKRALHFHLDTRRPDILRASVGQGSAGRRASLMDMVRDKLRGRPLTSDIDREHLVERGLAYLAEAEQREGTAALASSGGAAGEPDA
ncbi:MAG: DNA repair exonuclease [Gemmatimonadaceae bacterium]